MRIWSLHPKQLDAKGLVALWRETLLAKHVLEGKTKGYKNHPQLDRFKQSLHPLHAINQYLMVVFDEATKRGYEFNREKINWESQPCQLTVTDGQVQYETKHLQKKLKERDVKKYTENKILQQLEVHPIFEVIKGEIESWEVIT
jgi:hypothetical protein